MCPGSSADMELLKKKSFKSCGVSLFPHSSKPKWSHGKAKTSFHFEEQGDLVFAEKDIFLSALEILD